MRCRDINIIDYFTVFMIRPIWCPTRTNIRVSIKTFGNAKSLYWVVTKARGIFSVKLDIEVDN